jgi:hypothetical protein
MTQRPNRRAPIAPVPPIFGVHPGALLALGEHVTQHASTPPDEPSAAAPPAGQAVEIGLFTRATTFVGYAVIEDGSVRFTVREGVRGVVTLFISIDGAIHGVVEAIVGDEADMSVVAAGGRIALLAHLEAFGAQMMETHVVSALDPEAAQRWMSGLALKRNPVRSEEGAAAPSVDRHRDGRRGVVGRHRLQPPLR